jgi:Protein of unknown function (DUF3426)
VDAVDPVLDFGTPPPEAAPAEPQPEPGTVFDLQLLPEPEPEAPPEAETGSAQVTETAAEAPGSAQAPDQPVEPLFDLLPPQPPSGEPALSAETLIDTTAAPADAKVAEPADLRAEPDELPSFVRSAERAERWRSPRMRSALVTLGVVGTLALLLQAVFTYRDLVVARFPGSRGLIEPMCAQVLGCRIEAARSIESLAVESSGLVRVEKSSVYKLQVALRNRSAIGVAVPALELTLSDSQGKPIARRVLRAAELGVNQTTVAAGRELALQATLQTATEPVAGYTIELFYP